jgi:hypothetical protein
MAIEVKLTHDPTLFKAGDLVRIARAVTKAEGWNESWGGAAMDKTVGKFGKVLRLAPSGYEVLCDGSADSWYYPSCALESAAQLAPPEAKHSATAFRVGELVRVYRKPANPNGLVNGCTNQWVVGMDACIGKQAKISSSNGASGYLLEGGGYYFASVCLELVSGAIPVTVVDANGKPVVTKKKRVRVKAGPWDAAPCPHLRFMVLCFFRDKLALVKSKDGPTSFDVACSRCGTRMTLNAK